MKKQNKIQLRIGDKVMITFGTPIGKPFGPDTYDLEGRVRAVKPADYDFTQHNKTRRMNMTKTETYTTRGPVRGSCGHRHITDSGAIRCLIRDRKGCHAQGGYSDRDVYRDSDGARASLIETDDGAYYIEWI